MRRSKIWLGWLAASLGLGFVGAQASEQPGPPANAQPRLRVPVNGWVVDYGDVRCSLVHRVAGDQSPLIILSSYLGRDEPEFILMRDGRELLPNLPRRLQVVLLPGGQVADARLETGRVQGGTITLVRDLGEGFFDRFAAANRVRLQAGGRVLIDMPMVHAQAAVAAVKSCNDDLLRSWGADPARAATLQRRPQQTGGSINNADYPYSALASRQSGNVVVRLTIGVDGRVSNCTPVVSSHVPILDTRTCALFVERFIYDPALDASSTPVAWPIIRTVSWRA